MDTPAIVHRDRASGALEILGRSKVDLVQVLVPDRAGPGGVVVGVQVVELAGVAAWHDAHWPHLVVDVV